MCSIWNEPDSESPDNEGIYKDMFVWMWNNPRPPASEGDQGVRFINEIALRRSRGLQCVAIDCNQHGPTALYGPRISDSCLPYCTG